EFATWYDLVSHPPLSAPPLSLENVPNVYDLSALKLADVDKLRPLIGGKASGFLALLAPGTISTVDRPMAISIKPYVEHMKSITPRILAMMDDYDFNTDERVRYLVLEGPKRYEKRYTRPEEKAFEDKILAKHGKGDPVGDLIRDGGLCNVIE